MLNKTIIEQAGAIFDTIQKWNAFHELIDANIANVWMREIKKFISDDNGFIPEGCKEWRFKIGGDDDGKKLKWMVDGDEDSLGPSIEWESPGGGKGFVFGLLANPKKFDSGMIKDRIQGTPLKSIFSHDIGDNEWWAIGENRLSFCKEAGWRQILWYAKNDRPSNRFFEEIKCKLRKVFKNTELIRKINEECKK